MDTKYKDQILSELTIASSIKSKASSKLTNEDSPGWCKFDTACTRDDCWYNHTHKADCSQAFKCHNIECSLNHPDSRQLLIRNVWKIAKQAIWKKTSDGHTVTPHTATFLRHTRKNRKSSQKSAASKKTSSE